MKKKDLRKSIIRALENKSDEYIDKRFSNLIREELNDEDFWDYVRSWKDGDSLCDEMEDWDTETKRRAIEEIEKYYLHQKEVEDEN